MSNDKKCTFCNKGSKKVTHLIEGPKLPESELTIYICNECIDQAHNIIYEPVIDIEVDKVRPSMIKEHLDQYVIGQDDTKEVLSVAVYNHIKRLLAPKSIKIDKSNVVIIGDSGTGKTLLAKTVSKYVGLPCVIADATSMTEAGYTGDDVTSMLQSLIEKAGGNIEKAQRGVIFIDEIDKIARKRDSHSGSRDVSGEGVQQSLLKIIEGTEITVEVSPNKMVKFDTSDILFIASGAFIGIQDVVKKRITSSAIGFTIATADRNLDSEISIEDLMEYGLIPEFVGRFSVISTMESLNEDMLFDILTKPKNCLDVQFTQLFNLDGVALNVDHKYYRQIAKRCINKKTGARGLRSEIDRTLKTLQFNLPELAESGVHTITINEDGKSKMKKTKKGNMNEKK